MTDKPANLQWIGFTPEQVKRLEKLHFYGNNGWARNEQTERLMPRLLTECADAGLTLDRIKSAMRSVGHHDQSLHQLDRWETKRTTGKFGR